MNELLHGFFCCDMESYRDSDDGKLKYKLKFNPGRATGAALIAGVIAPVLTILY